MTDITKLSRRLEAERNAMREADADRRFAAREAEQGTTPTYWIDRFRGAWRVILSVWGYDSLHGRRCRTDHTVARGMTRAVASDTAARLRDIDPA